MMEESSWSEDHYMSLDYGAISCIEYDYFSDFIWIGQANGRVSTFNISKVKLNNRKTMNGDHWPSKIKFQKYSSFQSIPTPHNELNSLYQILSNRNSAVILASNSARVYSRGGLLESAIQVSDNHQLTCGTLISDAQSTKDPISSMTRYLLYGTDQHEAELHDLSQSTINGRGNTLIMKYSLPSPPSKALNNGFVVALAGQDGGISLLDGKLRSSNVICNIDGHAGSVNDIALDSNDGGRTLYSCGFTRRAINPYDLNSPFQYFCDPVVRVFDLRMHRQLAPLAIPPLPISSSSGVRFLRFIPPQSDTANSNLNPYLKKDQHTPSLMLCTADGIIQISELQSSGPNGLALFPQKVFFAPVAGDGMNAQDFLTAVAVCSTGDLLAVGTSSGGVMQYRREGECKVNKDSPVVKRIPPREVKPPLLSITANALVLGTAYTLCPVKQSKSKNAEKLFLSSSFITSPELLHQKLRLTSSRRIHHDLKASMIKQDFIGIIPNPEFFPNSMLYGQYSKKAYASCDPRKQKFPTDYDAGAIQTYSQVADDSSIGVYNLDGDLKSKTAVPEANPADHSTEKFSLIDIPPQYRRQKGPRGKQRIKRFEYDRYNETAFIGLENNAPNSYTNAILQLLYSIKPVRSEALLAQANILQHLSSTTLWCELGFLFHMLYSVERYFRQSYLSKIGISSEPQSEPGYQMKHIVHNVDKVVQPSNFQRTFQLVPEAVALGLFDSGEVTTSGSIQSTLITNTGNSVNASYKRTHSGSTVSEKDVDLQQTTQTFVRFLLSQLNKEQVEIESSSGLVNRGKQNVVDKVFGFYVQSCTTFLNSGVVEMSATSMQSLTLDLIYPACSPSKSPGKQKTTLTPPKPVDSYQFKSFSFVLWSSLQKETFMKGWCSVSESYEPFKQVRSVVSLPQTLTLLCGDTKKDTNKDRMSALGSERSTLNSSIHSMYWTSSQFSASTKDNSSDVSSTIDVKGKHWLPLEIEIAFVRSQAKTNQESNEQPQGSKLIISSKIRVVDPLLQEKYTWSIFDGATETLADVPASIAMGLNDLNLNWVVERFDLQAVLSQILSVEESQILLHVKVDREETREDATWMLFNDFLVQESHPSEVLSFPPWRHPCVVCFSRQNIEETPAENSLNSHGGGSENSDVIVPESVLHIQSISQVPCIRLVSKATSSPDEARLPQRGGLIAFDGEFVSVSLEQSQVSSNGQRVVQEEGRQILARMSLLYGGKAFGGTGSTIDSDIDISTLLADDYVLPLEPVLDYVTRFSGIVAEDLNPLVSKHPIITHRAAYLKLRYFIDREFIFVGHGLQKDFETANIFVPAHQIRDTVELWRLPNQRLISLRFLASYLLKKDIQDEIHDSIEDAKTALQLYRHYEYVSTRGPEYLKATLNDLYNYGHKYNWTIGLDRIPKF